MLPIFGRDEGFPVHDIYCVGQNYAAHAREMGRDPKVKPPVYFRKPPHCLVPQENADEPLHIAYPPQTDSLHHEIELVVALDKGGRDIPPQSALDLVFGYAVGLDLTRRDLQNQARADGMPWDLAKGFDMAAPCSAIRPVADMVPPDAPENQTRIFLKINGEVRQAAMLNERIWDVSQTISRLSRFISLKPGDLIFTGTPDGVGPVEKGDNLSGHIDGIADLSVKIV